MEYGFAAFSGRGLARKGLGIDGRPAGAAAFIETARNARGTFLGGPHQGQRHSNQMFTNGIWIGHGDYGGQFLMAEEAVMAFFIVLGPRHADDDRYLPEIIAMGQEVMARL